MGPSCSHTWSVYLFRAMVPTAVQQTWPVATRGIREKVWMDSCKSITTVRKIQLKSITGVGQSSHLQLRGTDIKWLKPLDIMTN